MNNKDVRNAITTAGVRYWQVANELGITDGNFSRKLRKELSASEKERIFTIIRRLEKKNS